MDCQRKTEAVQGVTGLTFRPGFFIQVRTADAGEPPRQYPIDGVSVDITIPESAYTARSDAPTVHLEFHRERTIVVERDESGISVTLGDRDGSR